MAILVAIDVIEPGIVGYHVTVFTAHQIGIYVLGNIYEDGFWEADGLASKTAFQRSHKLRLLLMLKTSLRIHNNSPVGVRQKS
jgi:hypothetical protein